MKAKLFTASIPMEICLANGVQFFATEAESKDEFIKRVEEVVDRDYVDTLQLSEVKAENIKVIAETVEAPKPKAEKVVKPKAEKVIKEMPSLESVIEAVALAKNNVQTICSFVPFRMGAKIIGEVKQVVIDLRVRRAYYRIVGNDGKLYHTRIDNKSFKVDEEATEKMLDDREKVLEEKKNAAKAKAEKAAKPKTEKVAKPKAEKAVKPKSEKVTGDEKPKASKGKGWSRTAKAE